MQQWFAQAPSNIALIKYMGKSETGINVPINPSLSYTIDHLTSSVSLDPYKGIRDVWEPLNNPGSIPFVLSEKAQVRFLKHLNRLKDHFKYKGFFVVRSSNNFPQGSGLASSASSFAALTKCATLALCELTNTPILDIGEQAKLSREGSGSSCRSFYAPWALWTEEGVQSIDLPYKTLLHQAIIISDQEKQVSSSEAHQRIRTSSLYSMRAKQAKDNLKSLTKAMNLEDWESAYQICWREFHAMHKLFTSCKDPFTYMTTNTHALLRELQNFWEKKGDGPIITMDAGPNIHLLYRPNQRELASQFKHDYLVGNYDVL